MTASQRTKNERIERLLFNDDLTARTDAEIAEATNEWHELEYGGRLDVTVAAHLWNSRECRAQRDGLDQESLEAHVAQWRKEPRDFCGDLNLAVDVMQPELERKGFYVKYVEVLIEGNGIGFADALDIDAEARVDAALRALESREDGAE